MRPNMPVAFVLLLTMLVVPSACGKKGPPFLPVSQMSLVVEQLSATWQDGAFHLQGKITDPEMQLDPPSSVTGCRIIYACYPEDNAPCEGCPIDYSRSKEIEGQVIRQGRFACDFSETKADGIYYFKVCLIGEKGAAGPYSSRAKLVVVP